MRQSSVTTTYTYTDDVTGQEFIYDDEDMRSGLAEGFSKYKVTIEETDNDGNVIVGGYKREEFADMHADTRDAIANLSAGDLIGMFLFCLARFFGDSPLASLIYKFACNRNSDNGASLANLLTGLGAKTPTTRKRSNPSNANASNKPASELYYSHIRDWLVSWGHSATRRGTLSTDKQELFKAKTGITFEKFNAGERAEMKPEDTFLSRPDMPANVTANSGLTTDSK